MRDPVTWFFVSILSCAIIAEMGVGGWLVVFLERVYRWSPVDSSAVLSTFFLCYMLARLLLGPLTDKIGLIKSVIVFALFSGACSCIAVLAGRPGTVFFILSGIGLAPIYPTVMAVIAKHYKRNSDMAITFIVTFLGIISMAGSFTTRAISRLFNGFYSAYYGNEAGIIKGLQASYLFISGCTFCCSLACYLFYRL